MRTLMNRICLGVLTCTTLSLGAEIYRPISCAEVAAGYRHDNFKWTLVDILDIDGNNWTMHFKDIQMAEITGRYSYTSCNNYTLRMNGGYGKIFDGNVRNSGVIELTEVDIIGNDDENIDDSIEYTRIHAECKRGEVSDFEAGGGYTFTDNDSRWVFTPLVGWSLHYQNFKLSNAKQVINLFDPSQALGEIPNFSAYYKPRWYGPWIGLDMIVELDVPCVLLFGSIEWHWVQFHAKGKWNYNDLFINKYAQSAHGNGVVATLGLNYRIAPQWFIGVVGNYKNFHGDHKAHQRSNYLVDILPDPFQDFGTMPAVPKPGKFKVRPIKWNSWSITASLDYRLWGR